MRQKVKADEFVEEDDEIFLFHSVTEMSFITFANDESSVKANYYSSASVYETFCGVCMKCADHVLGDENKIVVVYKILDIELDIDKSATAVVDVSH